MTDIARAARTAKNSARRSPWRRHALAQGVSLMLACVATAPAGADNGALVLTKGSNTVNREYIKPDTAATGTSPGKAGNGADGVGVDLQNGHGIAGQNGKAGAAGGTGATGISAASGSYFTLDNRFPSGQLLGGDGGNGGTGGTGGNGGNGSAGATDAKGKCPAVYRRCPYGTAGDGGQGGRAGDGGTGGVGVSGSHFTLINSGLVFGGAGGDSGMFGAGGDPGKIPSGTSAKVGDDGDLGLVGAGGAGVVSTGFSTVINSGLIAGHGGSHNYDGSLSADGHAIDFSGGGNRLVLASTDYMASFSGLVVSTSGRLNFGDTLEFGMPDDAGFSLQRLQNSFIGFAKLAKSGTATLALTAENTTSSTATFTGLTDVSEGKLQVGKGVTLAGTAGSTVTNGVSSAASVLGGVAVWVTSETNGVANAVKSILKNVGRIVGGQGAAGDTAASGGEIAAGAGNTAVVGSGFGLNNDVGGVIQGGKGGHSGTNRYGPTPAGAGGVGVLVADDTTLVNAGTISGGMAGDGFGSGARANAIEMVGNGNTLSLRPTSVIEGQVLSKGDNTFDLGGSDAGSFNAGLLGTQYLGFTHATKTGSANWTLTGTSSQAWVVRAGTLTGTTTSMRGNLSFDKLPDATPNVVFDQSTNGTYGGTISGDGSITITGGGTITFTQANSHTGRTRVSAGKLVLSGAGSFGAGLLLVTQGTEANISGVSASSSTVGALQGAGTVVLGSKNLRVDGASDFSFSGSITGTGGLIKAGSNTQTLATAQSYSGGTTIVGGALAINRDSALGTANTRLTLDGGALRATGSFSSSRPTQLGAAGGRITTDAVAALALNGVVSGAGTLTKDGEGTLVLNGTNTFSGGLQVNAGTLNVSSDTNLGVTPTLNVLADGTWVFTGGAIGLAGGTLRVTGDITTARTLTLAQATLSTVQVDTGHNFYLFPSIKGGGSLIKSGGGALVLNANNGPNVLAELIVREGSVVTNRDSALGVFGLKLEGGTLMTGQSVGGLLIPESFATQRTIGLGPTGGTFSQGSGTTLELDGLILGAGNLTKEGTGMLILASKSSNYEGNTVVREGTLRLAPGSRFGQPGSTLDIRGGRVELMHAASSTVGQAQVAATASLSIGETAAAAAGGLKVNDALTNAGQLSVEMATLTVGGSFVNTGTVHVRAGGRVEAASFLQTAGSTLLAGGVLASSQPLVFQGGSLTGPGTVQASVQLSGGRVEVGAEGLSVTGDFTQTDGTLDFDVTIGDGGYRYGTLTATRLTLAGTLEFTVLDASAADLLQLETDLLAHRLLPFGSGDTHAAFSSIRLDSTRVGVSDLLLDAAEVTRVDQAFTATAAVAVPEPAHWAMLLAGLGIVALRARRARVGD